MQTLTKSQAATLVVWKRNTQPDQYYDIAAVFGAHDNQDNGRRRIMYALRDKGLVDSRDGLVRGGNPLYAGAVSIPSAYAYDLA